MKRNCNGCKALDIHAGGGYLSPTYYFCSLGYGTTEKEIPNSRHTETAPTEECPKPKTNSDFVAQWNLKVEKRNC